MAFVTSCCNRSHVVSYQSSHIQRRFEDEEFFVTTSVSHFCVSQKENQVGFHAFKGIIISMGNVLKRLG